MNTAEELISLASHLERISNGNRGHGGGGCTYDDEVKMLREVSKQLAEAREALATIAKLQDTWPWWDWQDLACEAMAIAKAAGATKEDKL